MIADIVNDPRFKVVFSFILGFGIASLFRPLCASDGGSVQCRNFRAPDVKEMKDHIYRIGKKCYRFSPNTIECPAGGSVIEAFCTA
jgi:hypothetical protein